MTPSFWRNKRVFLTGHTGFKGSWLALWLQQWGASVVGYSLPAPTVPSLFETAGVARGMDSRTGDVRDLAGLTRIMNEVRPEIVFHMAAQPLVRLSYADPVGTYATNVMGSVHMLEAIRNVGSIRVGIIITSDKCYRNREWLWGYREDEAMGGHDPYSSSKGCAELVVTAYRDSFFPPLDLARHGVAIASVRAGNVIGGGDWAESRLIPDIMRAFLDGRPAVIRNPQAIRPWQYVLEPLRGYLALAEQLWNQEAPELCDGWNFGPAEYDSMPVAEVVTCLTQLWGGNASWRHLSDNGPHEATFLKLDCSKAHYRLAWRPVMPLSEALESTVHWYKAYRAQEDLYRFTLTQITDYEHRAALAQVAGVAPGMLSE